MAKFSLRRYDVQARFSVYISTAACLPLLAMMAIMFRHINIEDLAMIVGPKRKIAVLAAAGVTLLMAAIGFGMGFNSAGQRRNDKPKLSWIGFFISAGVLCITLVLLFLFMVRAESPIR